MEVEWWTVDLWFLVDRRSSHATATLWAAAAVLVSYAASVWLLALEKTKSRPNRSDTLIASPVKVCFDMFFCFSCKSAAGNKKTRLG